MKYVSGFIYLVFSYLTGALFPFASFISYRIYLSNSKVLRMTLLFILGSFFFGLLQALFYTLMASIYEVVKNLDNIKNINIEKNYNKLIQLEYMIKDNDDYKNGKLNSIINNTKKLHNTYNTVKVFVNRNLSKASTLYTYLDNKLHVTIILTQFDLLLQSLVNYATTMALKVPQIRRVKEYIELYYLEEGMDVDEDTDSDADDIEDLFKDNNIDLNVLMNGMSNFMSNDSPVMKNLANDMMQSMQSMQCSPDGEYSNPLAMMFKNVPVGEVAPREQLNKNLAEMMEKFSGLQQMFSQLGELNKPKQ